MRPIIRNTPLAAAIAATLLLGACAGGFDGVTYGSTSGGRVGAGSSTGTSGTTTGGGNSGGGTTGSGTTGGADTFTTWASPDFFQLYCVSCHSAGHEGDPSGSNLDWTTFSDVQLNSNDIRCGVAVTQDPSWQCPSSIVAEQFPIGNGPHPSDLDRIRLVAWINAGAPQ